jgi:hypothetical protein
MTGLVLEGLIVVDENLVMFCQKEKGCLKMSHTVDCLQSISSIHSPDFKPRNCLKYGHCSQGDSILWLFYFLPPRFFFGNFLQNWSLQPWFSLGDPILGIHSMRRGGLILEKAHTNHINKARFFHYGMSCIEDFSIMGCLALKIFPLWGVSHRR